MGLRTPFGLPSFKPLSRSSSPAQPPPAPSTTDQPARTPGSPPKGKETTNRGRSSADLPPAVLPLSETPVADSKRSRSLSRPLGMLTLRSSSTPVQSPTPSPKLPQNTALPPQTPPVGPAAGSAQTAASAGANGGGDAASYMEAVGFRMSEAVNRALVGGTGGGEWKGRKGIARGCGKELGAMIAKEFPAPPIDQYVLRAIVRTTVKYLSVFTTRLETALLPAVVDAAFASPILNAAPPTQSLLSSAVIVSPLNPCQTYALSLAHAAFEVHAMLGLLLSGGRAASWPKHVGESFKPVMDKLESVVGRVIQPVLVAIKRELADTLVTLKDPPGPHSTPVKKAADYLPSAGSSNPIKAVRTVGGVETVPPSLAAFASKVDASRRVLEKISAGCGNAGEGWVVGVVVGTIWKGMLGLVERPCPAQPERGSPRSLSQRLLVNGSGKVAVASGASTPTGEVLVPKALTSTKSATNVASLLTRTTPGSRPSSPPRPLGALDPATGLVTAFEGLVRRLVDGLVPYKLPAASDPGHLAREALAEALEALESLRIVVLHLGKPNGLHVVLRGLEDLKVASDTEEDDPDDAFLDALDDVPPILLFLLFGTRLGSLPGAKAQPAVLRPVPEILAGTIGSAYLGGFGAAEEYERRAGVAMRTALDQALVEINELDGREDERLLLTILNTVVDVI